MNLWFQCLFGIDLQGELNEIKKLLGDNMAKLTDFDAVANELKADIAAVAAKITDLTNQLAAGGMSAADEDAALAELQAQAAALDAVVNPPAPPAGS